MKKKMKVFCLKLKNFFFESAKHTGLRIFDIYMYIQKEKVKWGDKVEF